MDENTNGNETHNFSSYDAGTGQSSTGSETRNFSGQDASSDHSSTDSNGTNGSSSTGSGRTEEFKLNGEDIMAKIRELIEQGNVRRIVVRRPDGTTFVEFPLTAGVIGAALMPVSLALGAVLALASNLTILVEKRD